MGCRHTEAADSIFSEHIVGRTVTGEILVVVILEDAHELARTVKHECDFDLAVGGRTGR